MKKTSLFLLVFVFFQTLIFSQENLFDWNVSLSTGIPIHSSSSEDSKSDILINDSFNRIIIGFNGNTVINITIPVKLIFGGDAFCDFLWDGSNHYNSLDYSFYGGIKVFPNLGGFNFSISYVLGSKTTFYKTEESKSQNDNSAWGNGFRLSLEYDFFYNQTAKFYPIVGCYYKYIPRGDNKFDHILAAYAGLRF